MKLFRLHQPVIIFSVSTGNNPVVDFENSKAVHTWFTNSPGAIKCKPVLGRYNGKCEDSFIVPATEWQAAFTTIVSHNQNTFMYLDEYRNAFLVNVAALADTVHDDWDSYDRNSIIDLCDQRRPDDHYTYMGKFVPTDVVGRDEDYTFDPDTEQFYVTTR